MDLHIDYFLIFVIFAQLQTYAGALQCYVCNTAKKLNDAERGVFNNANVKSQVYSGLSRGNFSVENDMWYTGPDCDDDHWPQADKQKYLQDCGDYDTCLKMEQTVDGEWRMMRTCGIKKNMESNVDKYLPCVERTGTKKVKVYYCHCKTDGCNSASRPARTVALAALASLLALAAASGRH